MDASGPYGFGQIVYALGGINTKMVHEHLSTVPQFLMQAPLKDEKATTPPAGQVFVYPASVGKIEPGNGGDIYSELRIPSSAPSMPNVQLVVRLYNHQKQIGLDVVITSKTEERRKEAVYVAFPFAMKDPKFRLGMTNAVARPDKDFSKGACHEWYCVQDFVACRNGAEGVEAVLAPLDIPLITLSEINKGTWKAMPELTTSTVFSYAMNTVSYTHLTLPTKRIV